MRETEGRSRPKYLRLGEGTGVGAPAPGSDRAANDTAPAFTVTRGELAGMMREAVEGALAKATPLLVDRQGIARVLGCSAAHIDALRKRGLPALMVGQAVRFEPSRVIEWLREGDQHATHG